MMAGAEAKVMTVVDGIKPGTRAKPAWVFKHFLFERLDQG